ncbi:MFS transporter [Paenibacillus sp. D2_2]|uniref:MFS transporter n=1 Tax=Paenibacillus sp. D2_2 TaxID=3073092 RepID=UPI00281564FC|nr:MFS transporter [Paenibacillus sp. D2_2]WMT39959.1 MFS transporter [Paenibacillus sp. D2_2]
MSEAMPKAMTEGALSKEKKLSSLFAFKSFIYLLLARVISHFGDSIDAIAYSWMVYKLTGSEIMMGTLFALNYVPGILLNFFSGALVDRWSKRKVLLVTYSLRGSLVIFTALLYWLGWLLPWHLYVITLFIATIECFSYPAEMALVPNLLPKEKLLSANSISTSATRTAELAGLAIAGGIIAFLGISGAILINGITFFAATTLIVFIRTHEEKTASPDKNESTEPQSFFKDVKIGLKFLASNRLIITIVIAAAYVNLCLAPYNVLTPVYVAEILKSGPQGLSMLGIGLISGMIVSSLWISRKGSKFKKCQLILIGYMMLGLSYALLYLPTLVHINSIYLAIIITFCMGLSVSLVSTPSSTYFMETVPKELLGRVGAIYGMVCTIAVPIGGSLAGILGGWIKVDILFLIFGLLMILPFFYLLSQKSFRQI